MATKKKTTEKPDTVPVRFVGPNYGGMVERTVQIYRWNVQNGYVCNVPADVAEKLIKYSDFEIDKE